MCGFNHSLRIIIFIGIYQRQGLTLISYFTATASTFCQNHMSQHHSWAHPTHQSPSLSLRDLATMSKASNLSSTKPSQYRQMSSTSKIRHFEMTKNEQTSTV
mmetsp:Transcript_20009/g.32403  ORF Transcript_20009/g.32403 Transcript_20009/m.32403 type:complete len:102 (-) Transcript_20009:99-404(-)